MLRAFELHALAAAGLAPRLDACARCGGPLAAAGGLRFDPAHGGALCPACAPLAGPGHLDLTSAAFDVLARLGRDGLAAGAEPIAPQAAREVREAVTRFVEHHLGKRLAARKFLDEVGPALGS
jgi:DNA repair protein RecO (recombination protein O)